MIWVFFWIKIYEKLQERGSETISEKPWIFLKNSSWNFCRNPSSWILKRIPGEISWATPELDFWRNPCKIIRKSPFFFQKTSQKSSRKEILGELLQELLVGFLKFSNIFLENFLPVLLRESLGEFLKKNPSEKNH